MHTCKDLHNKSIVILFQEVRLKDGCSPKRCSILPRASSLGLKRVLYSWFFAAPSLMRFFCLQLPLIPDFLVWSWWSSNFIALGGAGTGPSRAIASADPFPLFLFPSRASDAVFLSVPAKLRHEFWPRFLCGFRSSSA